eukprot:1193929-Rhodomonas_salina.2
MATIVDAQQGHQSSESKEGRRLRCKNCTGWFVAVENVPVQQEGGSEKAEEHGLCQFHTGVYK